jgi:hypothetical protein
MDLMARQGAIRIAHFAHLGDQTCAWAPETAIHLLAKEIINKHSSLELPAIPSRYYDHVLAGARRIDYTNVRIEKRFHDIIPDIIVATAGGDLLIEVFVTNKVRSPKAEKIRQQKVRAIEVDVRHLRQVLDRSEVENQVIKETEHKQWLYAPEFETETPPLPRPIFIPKPPNIAASESGESDAIRKRRLAEALAAYQPPTHYDVPKRLNAEQRAKMMGQAPAMCKHCGTLTTDWATLNCDSSECVCRSCVSKH